MGEVNAKIAETGMQLSNPKISNDIHQIEFDEVWYFIRNEKGNIVSSKPLTIVSGEPWPGC